MLTLRKFSASPDDVVGTGLWLNHWPKVHSIHSIMVQKIAGRRILSAHSAALREENSIDRKSIPSVVSAKTLCFPAVKKLTKGPFNSFHYGSKKSPPGEFPLRTRRLCVRKFHWPKVNSLCVLHQNSLLLPTMLSGQACGKKNDRRPILFVFIVPSLCILRFLFYQIFFQAACK